MELYDKTGAVIKRSLFQKDYKQQSRGISAWVSFHMENDTLFYWDAMSDKVIGISKDGSIVNKWLINIGKDGIEKEKIKGQSLTESLNSSIIVDTWLESSDFIIIGGVNFGHVYSCIYDKKKRSGGKLVYNVKIKSDGFHNDIDGGYPIFPNKILADGSILEVIEPGDFQYLINTEYNKEIVPKKKNNKLMDFVKNLKSTDNPIKKPRLSQSILTP